MQSELGPIGVVSRQGPRESMEDRHVVARGAGGLFGGVYDGHGGAAAAELAAARLHEAFFEALGPGVRPEAAFALAYGDVDGRLRAPRCGTTAATFFLRDGRLTVAHVGDARIVLVGDGGALALTRDHRVGDPEERVRVLAAGADIAGPYVVRGDYGLMMTRSLGDRWFRRVGVVPEPEVATRPLRATDRHVVVASDGLWDELDTAQVGRVVAAAESPQAAAEALDQLVVAHGGRDNVTILVAALP